MKGIMIQGTSSDVGKSLITTALCRLFANEGVKVTPFKSQNMSNNSYVTIDGKEIGRAQGIQAEAAKTEAVVWMSPILLKPQSNMQSEVVLLGKKVETLSGKAYRDTFYEKGLEVIESSMAYLKERFDMVVIEGAGSPAEINLKDRELVNMKVAEIADVPVILVADIDRGGVFATIIGTLQLLTPQERNRVQGLMINKFRGDRTLIEDGVRWLEEKTGIPVLGVIPFIEDHRIDGEDSLQVKSHTMPSGKAIIDIAVIHHPFIANYNDVEPFYDEADVQVRLVQEPSQFGRPDAVIIPSTTSILDALHRLQASQLADRIIEFVKNGGFLVGIAGGFQMMGTEIVAGLHTGSSEISVKGLSIISAKTVCYEDRETTRVKGHFHPNTQLTYDWPMEGFQIDAGETEIFEKGSFFLELENGKHEGYYSPNGKVIGTYIHHLFHHAEWRNVWLNQIRKQKQLPIKEVANLADDKYDQLAVHMKKHLDWTKIKEIVRTWHRGDRDVQRVMD